jgi:catechol 2,3-dioxygenase-like lactoylglutathione lyase family enzyme
MGGRRQGEGGEGERRLIRRVLETAVYIDDLPRATRFYRDVLGLRVLDEGERLVAFDAGGATLLLLFKRGGTLQPVDLSGGTIPPHDGAGPAHVAFAVDAAELPNWEERLSSHGVAIESRMTWPRGGKSVYFRDPEGHSLELVTPGTWETY